MSYSEERKLRSRGEETSPRPGRPLFPVPVHPAYKLLLRAEGPDDVGLN